jgi:hypothetical protein
MVSGQWLWPGQKKKTIEKKEDRRKVSKKRKLEEVYQNLYQAEQSNNKFLIKIWKDIINKLESDNVKNKN